MVLKLDLRQRWLQVQNFLERENHININFSSDHCNYYTSWIYTTKEDTDPLSSPNHPILTNGVTPQTMTASQVIRAVDYGEPLTEPVVKKRKKSCLTSFDFSKIVLAHNIKNKLQLMALAHHQKAEGKTDFAVFVMNCGQKCMEETLATAWEMAEAGQQKLDRAKSKRVDLLKEALGAQSGGGGGCDGKWLIQARDI